MMKNQYKLLSIMLAGSLLTACSSDEPVAGDGLTAARITAGISSPSSRAVGSNWEADEIGVTVTDAPNSNMAQLYRNVRYKTDATTASADFVPSGDGNDGIFFQDASETVTFSAYGPFRDWNVAPGEDGFNIVDMADSQMGREAQKSVDFIHASGATASNASPTVTFTGDNAFRHVMSRLVVVIRIADTGDFSANALIDGNYLIGGMKLQALFNPYTGEAKASDAPAVNDWRLNVLPSATTDDGGISYTAIFPPQTLAEALTFTAEVDGQTYQNSTSIKPTLESGKSYQYTITVRKTGLTVSGCTITDWNDGGEYNGNASMPMPARIGDYFYSDGSYSHDPDPDKSCIGVVFWTPIDVQVYPSDKKPASPADDKILATDFPDCTNGLVIALTDAGEKCKWQETSESVYEAFQNTDNFSPANKADYIPIMQHMFGASYILGYQNTKILKAYNEWCKASSKTENIVPLIEALEDFESKNPAPSNTTGWFIPSVKELNLLGGRDEDYFSSVDLSSCNSLITNAGGNEIGNEMWSSTETEHSGYVYILRIRYISDKTKEAECATRPVLAF